MSVSIVKSGGTSVTFPATQSVDGETAHDAVDAGDPVKIGGKASTSAPTAVAVNDRVNAWFLPNGQLAVVLVDSSGAVIQENTANVVSGNASNTDGTSTQVIAAQGASVKTVLTACTVTNTSATPTIVELKDGATTKWTAPVPAGAGVVLAWLDGLVGTANTAWNFDMGAAVTTAYCSMSGHKTTT
jgi:hypothetical protein